MVRRCLISFLLLTAVISGNAQDSTDAVGRWEYLVEPYFMFPTMVGTVGIGQLPEAEVESGNIFDHLQSGFMFYAEAQNGTWAFSSDLLYMKLKQDVVPTAVISNGSVTMSETSWELAGMRKFLPWLEGGIAGRMLSIQAMVEVVRNQVGEGTNAVGNSATHTWFDPVFVVRMKLPGSGKWLLQLRGDAGGFGIGSDLTWQIQAYGGYRFSDLFQATVGYRVLAIDYEKGSEQDRFLYDITTSGPVVRVGFNL